MSDVTKKSEDASIKVTQHGTTLTYKVKQLVATELFSMIITSFSNDGAELGKIYFLTLTGSVVVVNMNDVVIEISGYKTDDD